MGIEDIENTIRESVRTGDLQKLYEKLEEKKLIKHSQARKFLELAREIKGSKDPKHKIIKALLLLEYQSKRKVIEYIVYRLYKAALNEALRNIQDKEIKENLYNVIEMLTIRFYKKEET